jgi:Skp family chaperone for outer membrane proteins
MKNFRLIALAALLAMFTVITAFAQGQQRPAAPTTAPATSGPIPETKIAFVNTEAFGDAKAGIARYVAAVTALDREFQPRQQELTSLQTQITTIADDINKLSASQSVVDPKTIQSKQDQGEKLQRDFKYKKEQYDADAGRRYREAVSPISEDIGKALDAFAKARGITMILDISKLAPAVLTVNQSMDVTAQFISEYNSKNPATASTAAPGRP